MNAPTRTDLCTRCRGTGLLPSPRHTYAECDDCGGTGYYTDACDQLTDDATDWPTRARATGAYDEPEGRAEPGYDRDAYTPCPKCEGGGWHPRDLQLAYEFRRTCPECHGSGGG